MLDVHRITLIPFVMHSLWMDANAYMHNAIDSESIPSHSEQADSLPALNISDVIDITSLFRLRIKFITAG